MITIDQLLLEGDKVTGRLREALAAGQVGVQQSLTGASTARFDLLDPEGTFLRTEAVFNQRSIVQLDDIRFDLVRISGREDNPLLTAEWEDWIVAALREQTGTITAAKGTTTRGEFANRLCEEAGVPCEFEPGDVIRDQIGRGITDATEDSWTCLTRLARDRSLRCISTGTALLFGSDDWLAGRADPIPVREGTGGIGRLGFTIDMGLPADSASFSLAGRWPTSQGHPVTIADHGPVSGDWLVATVNRSLTDERVTLTRRQQPLPEPEHEAVTPTTGVADPPVLGGTSAIAPDFVAVALTQNGKPYVFGAEASPSNASPRAFDCSELVEWALARVGVRFVDGSGNQTAACCRAGRLIPVADAVRTYGALLFRTPARGGCAFTSGHVAISLGDGRTIEARGRRYGTGIFSATSGRSWTHGGLVPGVVYR